MSSIKIIGLVLIVSILLVVSQILTKLAFGSASTQGDNLNSYLNQVLLVLTKAHFWIALLSLSISGLIWVYVLRHVELSWVYPMTSMSYVIMIFASSAMLGERITTSKILGTLVIALGIFILMWGGRLHGND